MPYISDLDAAYPDGDTHAGSVLDDDLRTVKANILDTFPNVTGVVTPDQNYFNRVAGTTSNVQTQLNNMDSGYTDLADAPYMASGFTNGTTVVGPYGLGTVYVDTWGVSVGQTGQTSIVHNLDTTHGLGLNDYIVTLTPYLPDVVVCVTQSASSFTAYMYDGVAAADVNVAFYFQLVLV